MDRLIRFIVVGYALGQIVNGQASKISVFESKNNIFMRTNGETIQLTSSHRDFDPSITSDGLRVVFARSTDIALYPGGVANTPTSDIAVINLESKKASVLFSGAIAVDHIRLHEYATPEIDIAHNELYLEVGDRALFAVNLTDGHTRFVADAKKFCLMTTGPNVGKLIVCQRRWSVDSFIYEFWVYNRRGVRLRPSSMDEFESEWTQNVQAAFPSHSKARPVPR
jgi:hypothetical protein